MFGILFCVSILFFYPRLNYALALDFNLSKWYHAVCAPTLGAGDFLDHPNSNFPLEVFRLTLTLFFVGLDVVSKRVSVANHLHRSGYSPDWYTILAETSE